MSDGYFYGPKRGGGWKFVVVSIISMLVGALLMVTIAPTLLSLFGSNIVGQASPSPLPQEAERGPQNEVDTPGPAEPQDVSFDGERPYIDPSNPVVDVAKALLPSIVLVTNNIKDMDAVEGIISQEQGAGSGVIISSDGFIITNHHVIEGADEVVITFHDGTAAEARIVGSDSRTDLAVLKVEGHDNLTPAALGDSDVLQVGEMVVAIGNPMGSELAGTVTVGYISALNRQVEIEGVTFNLIQTDASINLGNSGGALININGEVIGINNSKSYMAGYDNSGNPIAIDGIGFAIPITQAKPIITELIQRGFIARPGLGIQGVVIDAADNLASGIPAGILVRGFTGEDSAALKAGLMEYDIITHINGIKITSFGTLWGELDRHVPGDVVVLTLWRQDEDTRQTKTFDVEVVLQELNQ